VLSPFKTAWPIFTVAAAATDIYAQPCPLYGHNYPAPTSLATSKHVEAAVRPALEQLSTAKNEITVYGPLDTATTAFSLGFYSLDDEDSLFSQHYTPAQLRSQRTSGVDQVDLDTVYRLGSVSKPWIVYLFLLAAGYGSWNDPITTFIPKLQEAAKSQELEPTSNVDWEPITVGALASHLPGIGREPRHAVPLEQVFAGLGIPGQTDNSSSSCSDPSLVTLPCNRSRAWYFSSPV
jgi:hypothetical protein